MDFMRDLKAEKADPRSEAALAERFPCGRRRWSGLAKASIAALCCLGLPLSSLAEPRSLAALEQDIVGELEVEADLEVIRTGQAEVAMRPLDLNDISRRRIGVRFEISPRGEPQQLDTTYTEVLPARVRPGIAPGVMLIVVDSDVVERDVLRAMTPKKNSFSDFVWRIDTRTGHVLDARLEGIVVETLDWGITRKPMEARIRVQMSTKESAGFLSPRYVLGQRVFRHCDVREDRRGCTPVQAVRFNREKGYVNAVGRIEVESALGIGARSFSPLGEALFYEMSAPMPELVAEAAPVLPKREVLPAVSLDASPEAVGQMSALGVAQ